MPDSKHIHGSHTAWKEVYKDLDLSYSEKADSQGKLFELIKIDFLTKLFPPAPAKILEVGCGTAFVSLYFAKRKYNMTCLDVNQFILNAAKNNFKKEKASGKFVKGDAEKLPFANNQFDVVTSFGLLEHFANPSKAISEMVRVLKPGGLFFADIVPNRFSVQALGNIINSLSVLGYWMLKGKPSTAFKKSLRNFQPDYYENSLSFKQYENIMVKTGLEKIQVRGNRPFPRLTLPSRLDYLYAGLLKKTISFWKTFDLSNHPFPRFWGAGLWFWAVKKSL